MVATTPVTAGLPRWLVAVTALSTGWATLAAEMGLIRLITPYLGSSMPVWATVIAVVLVSVACGAILGGWFSRRGWASVALRVVLLFSGVLLCLLPLLLPGLIRAAVSPGSGGGRVLGGIAFLALAGLPLMVSGTITPLLVHLRTGGRGGEAGPAAGLVSACATLGGLAGSLVPAFVTLPYLGTSRTFLLAGGALLLSLVLAHVVMRGPGSVGPGIVAWLVILTGGLMAPLPLLRLPANTVAYAESAHHVVFVVRKPAGHLVLQVDAGFGEQSYYDPTNTLFYGPWPIMAACPLFTDPAAKESFRVMILGLGGGTAARMLVGAFPRAVVLGVEPDRTIVRLARRHMALDHPRIRVQLSDGRVALRRAADRSLDAVVVDAFQGVYVPFHLVTREFFRLARRKLRPGGVVVLNLVQLGPDLQLRNAVARTLRAVFPRVYLLNVLGGGNVLLIATPHPLVAPQLAQRARRLQPRGLGQYAGLSLNRLRPWAGSRGQPLTDDRAPVEPLAHAMLWRYLTR